MAEKYAMSDRMFEPISSGSYGPHLFVVAGQSGGFIDNPTGGWGCDAAPDSTDAVMDQGNGKELPGVFPCLYDVATLADVMDQRGVPWRFYATSTNDFGYSWSSYRSFNGIRFGPDWSTNVINPPAQIITDVEGGSLAAMTWVTPTNVTSDHPQAHAKLGPAWITSVVNAIGTSQFWDSTAIFITWDDWGGWYDHVPPPVTEKYFALGIRVPLIIVSPYARPGYVSHVVHSTGSILHFAEEALDLPSLGEEDARRDDLMDAFNFAQAPTPFATFRAAHAKADLLRAASQPTRSFGNDKPDD
jgi:phospholipase C